MGSQLKFVVNYIRYWLTASNGRGHGTHSPFVYDFIVGVLRGNIQDKHGFRQIERTRASLLQSDQTIQVKDLGAGSMTDKGSSRKVSSIAKNAAKHPRFARLLYRIISHYRIEHVLELGTSLGLTTRYLALAQPANGVITIEGAPAIAEKAAELFRTESRNNIDVHCGAFENVLPNILPTLKGRKLIFFDGNHQYAPTLDYFNQALAFAGDEDIFIFDDIHWSKEMENAWQEIKKNQQVACTIDLFFTGLVFFRKEFKEKQDFTIRF
jgi:predicted O-methyltransferase YrrM